MTQQLIEEARRLARKVFFAEVGCEDEARASRLMWIYSRLCKRYERRVDKFLHCRRATRHEKREDPRERR